METNAQGQIMVNDLKPGEYYFKKLQHQRVIC
ncbi:hypothetical protein OBG91_04975 [Lactococcus lactis]|nr:hypothetical protein [Lactococcus lactis]